MKKLLIVFSLLLCFPSISICQIKHGYWSGHFSCRGNSYILPSMPNLVIGLVVKGIGDYKTDDEFAFSPFYRWMQTHPEFDIHVPSWTLEDANGKIATQGPVWWRCLLLGDYKHNYNFSLGYSLCWRSLDIPLGAKVRLGYEWRGLCVTEGELEGLHKSSGIVPAFAVDWFVLGNDFEREKNWNIFVEPGVSYVKNLTYNDPLQHGMGILNDGWRASVAVGVHQSPGLCLLLRYEWDCYNYFNLQHTSSRLNSLILSYYYIITY